MNTPPDSPSVPVPKRASWSGQMSFVLAAAASAIGLGNLWRFPYLAAQYGGGTFILVYLVLVVTLGFTLMTTEIAIGRLTQQSQLTAYSKLRRGWGVIGLLSTIIPLVIVPYYCVIGGWVLKYFWTYLRIVCGSASSAEALADSGAFFGGFITAPFAPFGFGLLFILACALVIVFGVKGGIERSNKIMMPLLFLMAAGIAIYVCFLPGSGAGLKYYLVPNMDALRVDLFDTEGEIVRTATGEAVRVFSWSQLGKTVLGAMGQMFYSLSLAMGIMITYGSYMRKGDSIEKCVRRIEIFDTLIAVVAGLMIIPVVYMFAVKTGTPVKEAMNAGPGLMFVTLPKVFADFGAAGPWVGVVFFLLVIFAALTSAISLYEACVASVCDLLGMKRRNATFFMFFVIAFLAVFSAIGYGPWGGVTMKAAFQNMGFTGAWTEGKFFAMQFLDFFDFVTNSFLMPVVAALTCVFIGWVVKPKAIEDEVLHGEAKFAAAGFYRVMVKYVAPVLIVAVLISEICRNLGLGNWKI
ncbi:MAG: sodium-dependent transporter [Kiritimatiellae bacterium]|nr:sodium-dependent transporter [Kiritimatiellia bacterium]